MTDLRIDYLDVKALKPYDKNARKHTDADVSKIMNSIREFGFSDPIGVWGENNLIVEGHGRVMAAKKLGMEKVPCIHLDHLSDEQRRAYALAHNRTAELSAWIDDVLDAELDALADLDFDMTEFGFDPDAEELAEVTDSWFNRERKEGAERQEGNDEYNEFLEKFEIPKTTDDCYTPDKIYEAVADWVVNEYGVDRTKFVRPFYPGGDYQNENYQNSDIVVDNPPFSILSEILEFYSERKIRFFLFAPELTIFSSRVDSYCAVCCGYSIEYENKARVSTGFVTNLEDARFRSAPTLWEALENAMQEIWAETKSEIPKYSYPVEVVLSTMLSQYSKYGIDFKVSKADSYHIRQLDAQKEYDKAIYGSGYLISEKAAAEKAAATVWELSGREKEIIRGLGRI